MTERNLTPRLVAPHQKRMAEDVRESARDIDDDSLADCASRVINAYILGRKARGEDLQTVEDFAY